jgi:pilus assembly protein CpaB
LRWQAWPENLLNPVYVTRTSRPDAIDALAGAIIRNRMAAGEPVREENLIPRHAGYLATVLPPGKRALAVRVSAESTAGGFILPNDRVDVLHSDGKSPVSRTVLSNVRVLAIDQVVDDTTKNDSSKANVIGKFSLPPKRRARSRFRFAPPRTTTTTTSPAGRRCGSFAPVTVKS